MWKILGKIRENTIYVQRLVLVPGLLNVAKRGVWFPSVFQECHYANTYGQDGQDYLAI